MRNQSQNKYIVAIIRFWTIPIIFYHNLNQYLIISYFRKIDFIVGLCFVFVFVHNDVFSLIRLIIKYD